jgi:hypothetical protein
LNEETENWILASSRKGTDKGTLISSPYAKTNEDRWLDGKEERDWPLSKEEEGSV